MLIFQVTGVIDVQRPKDKGYETLVKEGLCDEVGFQAIFLKLLLLIQYISHCVCKFIFLWCVLCLNLTSFHYTDEWLFYFPITIP